VEWMLEEDLVGLNQMDYGLFCLSCDTLRLLRIKISGEDVVV